MKYPYECEYGTQEWAESTAYYINQYNLGEGFSYYFYGEEMGDMECVDSFTPELCLSLAQWRDEHDKEGEWNILANPEDEEGYEGDWICDTTAHI